LVKSLRSLDPWDTVDLETVLKQDFSDGSNIRLDVSAYRVNDRAELIRVSAEHLGAGDLFLQSVKWVDVTGALANPQPEDPGDQGFAYIRTVHFHEQLPDEQAVRTFAAKLLGDFKQRHVIVQKDEVRSYVRARKQAGDPEWAGFIGRGPRDSSWAKIK
jgi:hypothetical protein